MSNDISVYYQELLRQWSNSSEGKYRLKKCGEPGDWALLSFASWLDENATTALRERVAKLEIVADGLAEIVEYDTGDARHGLQSLAKARLSEYEKVKGI